MRKCRHCKAELPKVKDCIEIVQAKGFCSFDHMAQHGLEKARVQRERQERAKLRERKESIKTRSEHMRETQIAFNAYVRARDEGLPCISCGVRDPGGDPRGGVWDCSHYRSVGSCPELRFEELNAHKGCKQCNRDKSGNIVEYRISLRKRIGDEKLAWLEGSHEPKKYTIDELKEIKSYYRRMTRELQRQAA